MDKKVRIVVEEFALYRENRAIWSIIYVQMGAECFPCDSWTDATSSVLSMWLCSLNRFLFSNIDSVILPFMDGNYELQLAKCQNGGTLLRCTNGDVVTLEKEIDVLYFARQLLAAVGKIEKQYEAHANTPQVFELSTLAQKLRNTLSK